MGDQFTDDESTVSTFQCFFLYTPFNYIAVTTR